MGRLAGLPDREVARRLHALGFEFDQNAKGSQEIWGRPTSRRRTTLPNHPGEIPEGTLRAILKQQAGVSPEEFTQVP